MSEQYNQPVTARVYSQESFGSVDGPGVRFVIFLQGCAMRCKFCHNADSWDMQKGEVYSSDDLLKRALRFRSYWADKGGITISGESRCCRWIFCWISAGRRRRRV